MKALITGASSGIGREMAIYLGKLGYELFTVARREDKLNELKDLLDVKVTPVVADLSKTEECYRVYEILKDEDIDIVINNAGFGVFGEFSLTNLDDELKMIDLNIKSVHILTKLFIKDFIKKDKGYILNVSSSAGYMMGPLF